MRPASRLLSPAIVRHLVSLLLLPASASAFAAKGPKVHTVAVGKPQPVFWTSAEDPAVRLTMKVRPLVVDGKRKAWVSGDVHEITDHSFAALEVQHLNDALPGDKTPHFIWKATGWLLTERSNGHVSELKFAGYDPAVSGLEWFRDYAAFCAVSTTRGGRLDAEILQLGTRKPLARKKISDWPLASPATSPTAPAVGPSDPSQIPPSHSARPAVRHTTAPMDAAPKPQVCGNIQWQREPVQASFTLKPGDAALTLSPGPSPSTEATEPEQ